jgi:peptidyl-prolyl cis-trans isomerase SurA
MHRLLPLIAVISLGLVSCSRSAPANVAAMVNGRAITYADLDKLYATNFGSNEPGGATAKGGPGQAQQSGTGQPGADPPAGRPGDEQLTLQRMQVLRTLIDNEIILQRAEKEGLLATDADVEAKFAELRTPYTQEEFQKLLADRKMTAEDLKTQLRRELSVEKLINKETTSHITITDKEITDFYNANKSSFNDAEPMIHMAQILVTPQPDPNVRNLKNDKAQDDAQARKKIQRVYELLQQGGDFAALAENYSEDANSVQTGGDLGFIGESALDKANADLRKAVMVLQPGQVSPVIPSTEGYRILKVLGREPAGQRDLNDPAVQQNIREKLTNRKDQLLKEAYLEMARNEAKVVNYYAASVIADRDKK